MENKKLVQDFAKQIGKNIKEIRKNKILTQEDVAEIFDTTVLTIQRLEKRRI